MIAEQISVFSRSGDAGVCAGRRAHPLFRHGGGDDDNEALRRAYFGLK